MATTDTCSLIRITDDGRPVIRLTVVWSSRKKPVSTVYVCQSLPVSESFGGGSAWLIGKLSPSGDILEKYNVFASDDGKHDQCECPSFEHGNDGNGTCKHARALRALRRAGKI